MPEEHWEVAVEWILAAVGTAVIVAAGFGAAYAPRMREHALRRRTAWSAARSAVDSAAVSRDAARRSIAEAEELFHRAELLVAAQGGVEAALEAKECAARADRLWQAAADA
ncbi:DUF6403 family protein [Hoyosella sp. YIM 151337]|uniref:DUF6403 family protein n=1 Tax=Hoyosella sp. YIM 151337 TaxID=2992742 RepID=UPI002235A443|nr:DUF6403 family protein [Hoyosella sp. YIM 151337]MCW4354699.1 DUF6403 family protein [Hoyosella sp. YIM 151337]